MNCRRAFLGLTVIILSMILFIGPALAVEKKDKPARGIVVSMVYPGITVGRDENIRVDLFVKNTGRADETILFEITKKPEGWRAEIKGFNNIISGVFLEEDRDRTLTFSAQPEGKESKLPPGQYHFEVRARTADGAFTRSTSLNVTVLEAEKAAEAIKLTTSYPILRGPSDAKFEFSLDINNDSEADALFNLSASAPEGWDISFKPAYEDKQISSLRIKANQSGSVGVQVTPSRMAEAGKYPFKVRVNSPKAKAEVDLMVVLTGTYKIKTGTLDGLLSLSTQTGQQANMSIYVRNEGSAIQKEISFVSFKPENWKVEFQPEKIAGLKAGELKQVEVTIVPAEEALVGDYSVAVNAQGERSDSAVELRVTVKASSAWGWIGVAIIVLVIAGLAFTFRRLGRR